MDRLLERAAAWGLETEFRDAFGRLRTIEPDALARLLEAFPESDLSARMLRPSVVFRDHAERYIRLDLPDGMPVQWTLSLSGKPVAQGQGMSPVLTLPPTLPHGIFKLAVAASTPSGDRHEHAAVVVCPRRAYQGCDRAPRRMWLPAVQLYAVRSQRNWGHGDFGDLARLVALAAELGASGVALNPLHALFDDHPEHASPYSPSSRLFLNPLYIDVDSVPEFPGVNAAGLGAAVARLQAHSIVDYRGVADAKARALRLAHNAFRQSATMQRRQAFDRFRQDQGMTLVRFAGFEVLRRKLDRPWWEWPQEWRAPDDEALHRLRMSDAYDLEYHEFVQWIAHEQLDACQSAAAELGLPIGLYLDVAVGVRGDGFDAWCDQSAYLPRISIGAPPDILNTAGQNWGLCGFNPAALEARELEPFARMLTASMRYSGAIRLDHVLGIKRLFVIPEGMRPASGTYIRFPFDALLGVTTLMSTHHRCIVIGEDLGTVPDDFRETLADWGLWSYQVMLFERSPDGTFEAPGSYRTEALVTFGTHDLPTFAGWMAQRDLATKAALGLDPGETGEERRRALHALQEALARRGMGLTFPSVAKYLAETPARLMVIAIEDVLEVAEQINVPGTIDEHPNWRRRLPVALEALWNDECLRSLAAMLADAGRSKDQSVPSDGA